MNKNRKLENIRSPWTKFQNLIKRRASDMTIGPGIKKKSINVGLTFIPDYRVWCFCDANLFKNHSLWVPNGRQKTGVQKRSGIFEHFNKPIGMKCVFCEQKAELNLNCNCFDNKWFFKRTSYWQNSALCNKVWNAPFLV